MTTQLDEINSFNAIGSPEFAQKVGIKQNKKPKGAVSSKMDKDGKVTHYDINGKELKEETMTNESIKYMLESVMEDNHVESSKSFAQILAEKIAIKLEEKKIAIARSLFGGVFAESKDEDEDDSKSDEVGEEEENKHPLIQLKKIASFTKNTDDENELLTKTGTVDKRKVNASTGPDKPETFKHTNGEESEIDPDHAKHLVDVLSSSSIKPETKKQVFNVIHGSKAGLQKVQSALGTGVIKNKSIYGDDARV